MKKWLFILINTAIVILVLTSYKENLKLVDPTASNFIAGEYKKIENVSVNLVYESTLDTKSIEEVKSAITSMPAAVIKQFVDDDWKIAVVSDINFTDSDINPEEQETVAGLCNFRTKTVQVKILDMAEDVTGNYYIRSLHELSHFADKVYGDVSQSEEFQKLYEKYKGSYVEYEYEGMDQTGNIKTQIEYATINPEEFFACTMKDYIANEDYLRRNYTDIYVFLKNMIDKGVNSNE